MNFGLNFELLTDIKTFQPENCDKVRRQVGVGQSGYRITSREKKSIIYHHNITVLISKMSYRDQEGIRPELKYKFYSTTPR